MLSGHSQVPMYIQIEENLKERIRLAQYKVGESIPSERELAERFEVSRMTVRQAVTNLVNNGLLYREKGRGTFVAMPKFEQPLTGLTSFTEDMKARGRKPGSILLQFEKMIPSFEITNELQLQQHEEVFYVVRIRTADDKPMAIERTYIPVKIYPSLDEEKIQASFYELIKKENENHIGNAIQQMEAAIVSKEDKDYLQISSTAPVLIMKRTSFLVTGVPFEIVRSTYRADRYKFISEIKR